MPRQYGNVLDIQDYNPFVFEGTTIAPKLGDVSFLAQSIKDREQRQLNATQQQRELNNALGEARKQLHNDEETKAWFDAKQQEIMDTINSEITVGNYGNAMNLAIQKAGELANDDELQQRIKSNKDYTNYVDFLDEEQRKGNLNDLDYQYLKAANAYSFDMNKDWQPTVRSINSFDEDRFWVTTKELLAEYRYNKQSNTTNFDENANMLYTTGGTKQINSKTPEALRAFAKTRLLENEELKRQAEQRYNAYMYKVAELDNQIKKLQASDFDGSNSAEIERLNTEKESYYVRNENGVRITNPIDYMVEKQIKSEYPNHIGYTYTATSNTNKENPKGRTSNHSNTGEDDSQNSSERPGLGPNVEVKGTLGVSSEDKAKAYEKSRRMLSQFSDDSDITPYYRRGM